MKLDCSNVEEEKTGNTVIRIMTGNRVNVKIATASKRLGSDPDFSIMTLWQKFL